MGVKTDFQRYAEVTMINYCLFTGTLDLWIPFVHLTIVNSGVAHCLYLQNGAPMQAGTLKRYLPLFFCALVYRIHAFLEKSIKPWLRHLDA